VSFSTSHRHALLQGATSELQKAFGVKEFIQRHYHTLMFCVNFGLTWPLVLFERLQGKADFDRRQQGKTQTSR